jgi:hypothetical protein
MAADGRCRLLSTAVKRTPRTLPPTVAVFPTASTLVEAFAATVLAPAVSRPPRDALPPLLVAVPPPDFVAPMSVALLAPDVVARPEFVRRPSAPPQRRPVASPVARRMMDVRKLRKLLEKTTGCFLKENFSEFCW